MQVRYRVLPPVDGPSPQEVARALPTDPTRTDDCCGWLLDRGAVADRERAREWLPFLAALGLAAETDEGYHRVEAEPAAPELRRAFVERIYGADDLVAAFDADDVRPEGELADAIESRLPEDRANRAGTDVDRSTYVLRLIEWADRLDLLESTGGGYRLASADLAPDSGRSESLDGA